MGDIEKSEVCCVIISYNPEVILLQLIKTIENQVDKIILVDNNSKSKGLEIISKISDSVLLISNNENFGIARALNQGIMMAARLNYKWVITFDQDTEPFANIIETISVVYSRYPDKNRIGAIGVSFINEDLINIRKTNSKIYQSKDYLITSGSLTSTNSFLEIGGFREDFFIDNVDLEYSLRLRKNGKISLISKEIGMIHKAGSPKTKKVFGITFKSSNHNSLRRYYMARNHVILSRDYIFVNPYFIAKLNFFFFRSLLLLLLIDDDKTAKIVASLKGLFAGIFYSSKRKKLAGKMQ